MGEVRCTWLADDLGVAVLAFDNPPLGFLDSAMTGQLDGLLAGLAANPDLRALVLTGATPGVMVRHFDLGELSAVAESLAGVAPDPARTFADSIFHRITRVLEGLEVPVIAAINGDCMGVGYELALACDIRVAQRGAFTIGLPEVHIAMCPGGGGTARLARLIGPGRALALIATGTVLDPEAALAAGLVDQLADDALAAALAMARAIAARSPGAIAAAKRVVLAARDLSIDDALTVEQRAVDARLGSDEVRSILRRYARTGADLRHPLPSKET